MSDGPRATGAQAEWLARLGPPLDDHVDDKAHLVAVHALIRSKLVAMGASIMNLLVGGVVRTYTDRREFEARYCESMARAGRPSK